MRGASSDPPEVADLLWRDWGGRNAWDVGANIGQSVEQLLELFDHVECFEPATESFAALALKHVDTPGVRLHRYALSDHDGILETSIREVPIQTGQLVAMHMPYENFEPGVSSAQEDALPWGREIATRDVLCLSADTLTKTLGTPDFMKIDTEGGEADVLRGASDLLSWGRVSFLIEFHSFDRYEDCIKILHNAGYTPETVRHPHYRPESFLWNNHGWIRAAAPYN